MPNWGIFTIPNIVNHDHKHIKTTFNETRRNYYVDTFVLDLLPRSLMIKT